MLASYLFLAVGMVESVVKRSKNGITMSYTPDIGNIILNELNRQNHSLTWLAKELHISTRSLHRYIEKPEKVRIGIMFRICQKLRIDLFYCYTKYLTTSSSMIEPPKWTDLSE